MIWRLLTSSSLKVTLHELETSWSVDDLDHAHAVIDALERAEALQRAGAKA